MLRLTGRSCVVVGGGHVAERKISGLLEAEARVTVISPALTPALTIWAEQRRIEWQCAYYANGMLSPLTPLLVFAATNSAAVNQQVAEEAHHLGCLVNRVDQAEAGDFNGMSTIRQERITIAISTGGGSPALTKHLRQQIESVIGTEYPMLLDWMAEIRAQVQASMDDETERRHFWQTILDSPLLNLLRQGETAQARTLFDQLSKDMR